MIPAIHEWELDPVTKWRQCVAFARCAGGARARARRGAVCVRVAMRVSVGTRRYRVFPVPLILHAALILLVTCEILVTNVTVCSAVRRDHDVCVCVCVDVCGWMGGGSGWGDLAGGVRRA